MIRRTTSGDETRKFSGLEKRPEQLTAALRMLFELLEGYAPIWYTEQHHKIASAALGRTTRVERGPTAGRLPPKQKRRNARKLLPAAQPQQTNKKAL